MRVAFYIDNEKCRGIDFSKPEKGNPGIGGTQFMFWSVAYYLNQMYADLDIYIFAPIIDRMPSSMKSVACATPIEAIKKAQTYSIDIIIIRGVCDDRPLFNTINQYKQKTIFWCHNPVWPRFADQMANCRYVLRNVCVGKEQLDELRDHVVFNKSTYIFNALDFTAYAGCESKGKGLNIVGYMGALIPDKGFHRLAKVWKDVLKQVPDAQLYVLGGVDLYGKELKRGSLNISDEAYERKIMKYLSDGHGHIHPSVHFMGVVSGTQKLELLNKLSVGVVNPIGTETFCIVAIEFEYLKIPVVSLKKGGVLDTILDKKTGLLFNTEKEFVNDIVSLLQNRNRAQQMGDFGHEYVARNFEIHQTCAEWKKLFDDCNAGRNVNVSYEAKNWFNNLKWLREGNRRIKSILLFKWLPSISWYKQFVSDIHKSLIQ
ncbi:MAG: glycosyltransferase family 4 protein [Porphyromonadaceae bacterium]|nr:glycosyltransferase family 4 protein [Porphyromonadaceae bacterium]